MNMMKLSRISLAFACLSGFGLAACSDADSAANADSATYDTALEDEPCAIVTTQMVASTFDIPEADVEQFSVISSMCSYEMEDGGKKLDVEVSVDAYDTAEDAANYFRRATRSMSSEEVSNAMQSVRQQANEDGAMDTDAKADTAESIESGVQQGDGIQFEDVNGVADQARLDTSDGTLHLQEGNLLIELKAYYGPAMQIPDSYEPGSMQKVVMAWLQDTMDDRKAQSAKLAKAALAEL